MLASGQIFYVKYKCLMILNSTVLYLQSLMMCSNEASATELYLKPVSFFISLPNKEAKANKE